MSTILPRARRSARSPPRAPTRLALASTASAADTSKTVALKKAGDTRLTLDKKAGAALKSLGIKVAPVSLEARRGRRGLPDHERLGRSEAHRRRTDQPLRWPAAHQGPHNSRARNLCIRVTGSQATISASVGTTRATIINLDLAKAKATRPALNLRLKNVGVKLNATGASALNKAFKTSAFKSGLKLGTAVVNAASRSSSSRAATRSSRSTWGRSV